MVCRYFYLSIAPMSLEPTLALEYKGGVVHFLALRGLFALRTLDRIALGDRSETIEVVLTQRRVADVSIERHVSPILPSQVLGSPFVVKFRDVHLITSIIRKVDVGFCFVVVV